MSGLQHSVFLSKSFVWLVAVAYGLDTQAPLEAQRDFFTCLLVGG
jgi:hypothetical protein